MTELSPNLPRKLKMHIPVLLNEAVTALDIKENAWYIDATFGRGGHTTAILNKGGRVVALDYDQRAIEFGQVHLADYLKVDPQGPHLILVRDNFDHLAEVWNRLVTEYSLSECAGILFDFGTSSEQLTSTDRGLSFFGDETAELDMRLDERLGVKAKDLLLLLSERDLAHIFREYGGEEQSRSLAREIVARRKANDLTALTTVGGFVHLIEQVKKSPRGHLHPATKVFQALRIAVNDELGNIDRALPQALSILPAHGRIVTIAFHEGEDRIVKNLFREWEKQGTGHNLYKHPLTPSETEVAHNSKARSGKLRAFEKK